MGWEWPFGKKKNQPAETSSEQDGGEPQWQSQSYVRSYSSSKTCRKDPENDEFMICKERINDGNQTIEKEERIPIKQQMPYQQSANFNMHFKSPMEEFGRFQDLDRMFEGFLSAPFFSGQSPFNSFSGQFPFNATFTEPSFSFFPNQQQSNPPNSTPQFSQSQQSSRANKNYFCFKEEKDYDIKDI